MIQLSQPAGSIAQGPLANLTLPGPGLWQRTVEHTLVPSQMPARHKFRPIVVLFIGRRWMGKTLSMTALAQVQQQRYHHLGVKMGVASNYYLSFADVVDPYLVDRLLEFPPWAHHLLVCIDEVGSAFPNRRSLATVNVLFSQFLTQIRKRDCECVFTTQFPQVLDYQLLIQVDLFVDCEQYAGAKAVHWRVWDYWGQWTGNMRRKRWPPYMEPHDWEMDILHTDKVFSMYHTKEVVAPIWSKRRDSILGQYWNLEEQGEAGDGHGIPEPPKTLEETLTAKTGPFSVFSMVDLAGRLEPSIKNPAAFKKWLEAHGYKVAKDGGQLMARKE